MTYRLFWILPLTAALLVAACSDDSNTLVDVAEEQGFNELAAALDAADLVDTLADESAEFTVFAPTDSAFAEVSDVVDGLTADQLRTVLLYHVVPGRVPSTAIPALADSAATNAAGNNLTLLFDTSSGVAVNGVGVDIADVEADNGLIHVIDQVLIPPSILDAAGIAGLTSLADAIGAAAETDSGPVATVLSGDGPFTVFAPTNEAFADIQGTVDMLSAEQVRDVLLYHVIGGSAVLSTDLSNGPVTTALGEDAVVDISASPPTVATQPIAITDINVTNGVVHVVGGVLIPPSLR